MSENNSEALMKALLESNWDKARKALADGANINEQHFLAQKPLLCFFTAQGNQEVVEFLLNNGADINLPGTGRERLTPLLESIANSRPNLFTLLIERGADINGVNVDGVTPLVNSMWIPNSLFYVKTLLEAGADVNQASKYGTTPLLAAFGSGQNDKVIEALLEYNPDPRPLGEFKDGVLMAAVKSPSKDRLASFLRVLEYCQPYIDSKEIDLENKGRSNMTVLAHVAGFSDQMTYALLQKGASPHEVSHNSLHTQSSAVMILSKGDFDGSVIGPLLDAKVDVNHRDSFGNNILAYVLSNGLEGRSGIIKMLVNAGLNTSAPITEDGFSPFHLVVDFKPTIDPEENESEEAYQERVVLETKNFRIGAAKMLLDMGFPSYPDVWVGEKYASGERFKEEVKILPSPLLAAFASKQDDLADVMLSGNDSVNRLNASGFSLLHGLASFSGQTLSSEEIMSKISKKIEKKATESSVSMETGTAGFHDKAKIDAKAEAKKEVEAEVSAELRGALFSVVNKLNSKGADWNVPSKRGVTPLQMMATANNHELMGCLIARNGIDISYRDSNYQSVLDYALLNGSGHALFSLLGHLESKGQVKEFDDVLINLAFEKNPEGLSRHEMKKRNKMVVLLDMLLADSPGLLEARDSSGNTPLIVAAANGNKDLVNRFLRNGADPNAQNDLGETAVLHSAINGHTSVCYSLIEAGADMQLSAKNGTNALAVLPELEGSEASAEYKKAPPLKEATIESIQKYKSSWSEFWAPAPLQKTRSRGPTP